MTAPLVGRDAELAELAGAVTAPPAVAVVEGESGVGKTRLIQELAHRAELAGGSFVVGGARSIQEPFPLGPVLEAVRAGRDLLTSAQLTPVAGAVRPLLPELAEKLPPAPDTLADRAAERHRVFRGLREVLRALGRVTMVLEDLHWADGQTLDFLRYLLAEPLTSLAVVVTFRGEDAGPRVRAATARLPPTVTRVRLVLGPLSPQQTGELAAALVDSDAVSADFAAFLCERTGVLPYAIEEVIALLRERGKVTSGDRLAHRALAEAVPVAVRDQVFERMVMLPAAVRPVVEAAAVLQQGEPEHLITEVSGLPPAEAAAGLSSAIEAKLLVEGDSGIGLRHALAAQAVYDGIPGPRRRELHHRAATALLGRGSEALGQAAHHLQRAGRLDEWAVTAERVAALAMTRGSDDEAASLLAEVLRLAPLDPARRGRIAVKLAQAALESLHPGGAGGPAEAGARPRAAGRHPGRVAVPASGPAAPRRRRPCVAPPAAAGGGRWPGPQARS